MQRYVQAYQKSEVHTASRGDILVALFDGAVRFTTEAKQAAAQGAPGPKGIAVGRAMAIMAELTGSLEPSRAPELCSDLTQLYTYLMKRMQQAGSRMDPEIFEEVLRHLKQLRQTWHQAVQKARQEGHKV